MSTLVCENGFNFDKKKTMSASDISETISILKGKNFFDSKLIGYLESLNEMVGLEEIKKMVSDMVRYTLVVGHLSSSSVEDGDMNHVMVCGPPGCGKTSLAKIIGGVFSSLLPFGRKTFREEQMLRYALNQMYRDLPDPGEDGYIDAQIEIDEIDEVLYDYGVSRLEEEEPKVIFAGKQDLVGRYMGHSSKKTEEFLEKNRNSVIILDEAYVLCADERDTFGLESATVINTFMDKYPSEYVFIIIGYDNMKSTIFKAQPGMQRRIKWAFEITKYTPSELFQIFQKKIGNIWRHEVKEEFFVRNYKHFKYYGGDVDRFIHYAKVSSTSRYFKEDKDDAVVVINDHDISSSIKRLESSCCSSVDEFKCMMYG